MLTKPKDLVKANRPSCNCRAGMMPTRTRQSGPRIIPARLARFGSAPFLQIYAMGLCVTVLATFVWSCAGFIRASAPGIFGGDFVSYYSGAHLAVTGSAAHIYNLASLGRYEETLVYPNTMSGGVLPYVYPPYLSLLMAPLDVLPYIAAWVAWLAINCLLLAWILRSLRQYLHLAGRSGALLLTACLSFPPVFMAAAVQGQTSILLLALFTGAFFAVRAGREWQAGVLLSLTIMKPQYALPFLLVLAIRRHWAAIAAFAASSAGLIAVPIIVLGPGVTLGYVHILRLATTWHGQFGYGPALNQSVSGFADLVFPPNVATPVTALISVAALACLVRVTRRSTRLDIPLALAVMAAFAISPHVLIHDMSLLILPAAVAVRYRRAGPRHLGPVLSLGYVAALISVRPSSTGPIQLSVVAMFVLAAWLYRTDDTAHDPVIPREAGAIVAARMACSGYKRRISKVV